MHRLRSTVVVVAAWLVLAGFVAVFVLWRMMPEPVGLVPSRENASRSSAPGLPAQPPMSIAVRPATPVVVASLAEDLQETSLRGTQVDRPRLEVVDGQLVLNGTILFYFDYFLSLEGEMSRAAITGLVKLDLYSTYPDAIAQQLFDLFQRYLGYLDEVAVREAGVTREQVIAENLSAADMQAEVRENHFSRAEIGALFGDYDAMLGRASQASLQQQKYQQYQEAIRQNPGQMEGIATEMFGPVAAQNLRNLQYERQQWEGRMAHYQREKQAIISSYAGDPEGRDNAVALLQQRLFSATEQRRVQALDRIRQHSPAR